MPVATGLEKTWTCPKCDTQHWYHERQKFYKCLCCETEVVVEPGPMPEGRVTDEGKTRSKIVKLLLDVLKVEIEVTEKGVVRTDSQLLCGMAPVGEGSTVEESLVVFLARVIGQDNCLEGRPGYTRTLHDAMVKAGI